MYFDCPNYVSTQYFSSFLIPNHATLTGIYHHHQQSCRLARFIRAERAHHPYVWIRKKPKMKYTDGEHISNAPRLSIAQMSTTQPTERLTTFDFQGYSNLASLLFETVSSLSQGVAVSSSNLTPDRHARKQSSEFSSSTNISSIIFPCSSSSFLFSPSYYTRWATFTTTFRPGRSRARRTRCSLIGEILLWTDLE